MTRHLTARGAQAVLLFGLAGCYTPAPAPEITDGRPLVEVETIGVTKTDTTLPTDLLPLAGDDLLVLDGYTHRALRIDGEPGTATALQGDEVWGQPEVSIEEIEQSLFEFAYP